VGGAFRCTKMSVLEYQFASSLCPKIISSLESLKHSHWSKRKFFPPKRAEFYFLKFKLILNQTARGNALIWIKQRQECNKETSWVWYYVTLLGQIMTVRRLQCGISQTNTATSLFFEAICCHSSYNQISLPKFLKTNILNVYPRFVRQNIWAECSSFEGHLPVTRCCVQLIVTVWWDTVR